MKKLILLTLIALIPFLKTNGQGTVRGKITDKNGETLIGATVVLKSNTSIGSVTDFDGNYSIKISDVNPATLIISFISYKTTEVIVNPKSGEVLVKNFVLESLASEVKTVEVVAKATKARDSYMEKVKLNSAATIDYISSETMKKTGDANATSAIARVSGVSTNGGFITVRGIGDRYIKTAINGSRIPTLDPFTNNIKLDLFPSSLIDNIIITKTASPDISGDWAGAYLSVETKDYPEELAVNVESSFGYNTQSTFNDVITSQRSNTDWLGYDKSFRDHDHSTFVTAYQTPNTYQQFVALGLGNFYNSMGVNQENWNKDGSNGNTYFKLGLIQLGLLDPALINDPAAINNARDLYYKGPYVSDAFKVINANVPKTGQSFPANWNISTRRAPINFTQSFSVGNQIEMFGKPLGFLVGFRYGTANLYDPNASANRLRAESVGGYSSRLTEQSAIETNGWNALINLSYKLNTNNSISLLFMPNYGGVNKVRTSDDVGDQQTTVTLAQNYEQRKQMIYQYKSEHYIPGKKIKIEANASYTAGTSSLPDFKNLQYWKNPDNTYQIGGTIGDGIKRFYRYLEDDLLDTRISAELPIDNIPGLTRKIKFGGAYQLNKKQSDQYVYDMTLGPYIGPLQNQDIDSYLNLNQFAISSGIDNFGVPYSTLNAFYYDSGSPAFHTFGNTNIIAGFAMADYSITSRLRATGGLRVEYADIYTDVNKFDSLGYERNDPRRNYSSSYPLANPGELKETSFLPSLNLIYKLRNDEEAPMNIRANFSQTVARPSVRELSDVAIVDYEYRAAVYGNSDLKMVRINNYDLRLESYFKSGDNVSASVFFKDFKNHIELVNSGGFTWQNVDQSHVYGIELEARKKLGSHFELGANIMLAKSKSEFVRSRIEIANGVKTYVPLDTLSRSMFGQAPYVLNGILNYHADSLGLVFTLSYNVQGPRLVIASDNIEIPDVYEMPRHLLDFKVTKRLGKHFSLGFRVRDILNTPVRRSYNANDFAVDFDNYTYGTNYILDISYRL